MDLAITATALDRIADELLAGASGWLIAPLVEQAWDRAIVGVSLDQAHKDAWILAQGVIFGAIYISAAPPSAKELTAHLRDVAMCMRGAIADAKLGERTRTGQDGEPVRDVTPAEYEEHCKHHEPPPLGCERHHPDGERCCDTCAFPSDIIPRDEWAATEGTT